MTTEQNCNINWKVNLKSLIIVSVVCMIMFIPSTSGQKTLSELEAPDFENVRLFNYNVDVRDNYDNFWTSMSPSKYITPDDPIIRYYANNTDEIQIDYIPDSTDYWQNPAYTLKIGQGDCEDEAFVWVSIHRANGHKAIAVGGYLYFDDGTYIRDMWYEYTINNTHQIKFTTPVVNIRNFYKKPLFMFNDKMSIRDYDPEWMNK